MAVVTKVLPRATQKTKENTPIKREVGHAKNKVVDGASQSSMIAPRRTKKVCSFCTNKTEPKYWDITALRRYLSDRGRIVSRTRSGSCAKHQRRVAREIKRARFLALLPFTVKA